MEAPDISNFSLFLSFLLLVIPLVLSRYLQLGITKSTVSSVLRMSGQLFLVGVFLQYLFAWNNSLINVLWFMVMVVFATFSVVKESELNIKLFLLPTFISFALANSLILLYFNGLIINLTDLLDAKYLIAIGGMLLGNSLKGNVVGISNFYQNIKRDENRYLYNLALGANQLEVLLPYIRKSLNSALKPTIASMATMGVVFLPGMMAGQILGGMSPLVAIKYQIAIMIAIFVSTTISVALTIMFTVKASFSGYGILKKEVFKAP